jgi:hypothetical protein
MNTTCRISALTLATLLTLGLGLDTAATAQAPGSSSVIKCDAVRIDAAGSCTFGAFTCHSKHAKSPLKDPGSLELAVCLQKWGEKATIEFDKAGDTAVKVGGSCSFDGSTGDFISTLGLFAKMLTDEITEGVDVSNRADNKGRSILIKESGRYTDAILAAESRNVLYPDPDVLEAAKAKALNRFMKKTTKTLKKLAKAGLDYQGPEPVELAEIIEEFTAMTVTTLNQPLDV